MSSLPGRVPEAVIDDVRQASDIVEVIGEVVPLRRAGKNYVGLCPFHAEKTPSFTVSPDKQMFYCFGCGAGGNVFTFVMRRENLGFGEALRHLADRAGIALPSRSLSAAERRREEERALLRRVLELAQAFYRHNLEHTAAGRRAREYLHGRGLDDATIDRFGLGYAPDAWDGFLKAAGRRGHGPDVLVRAGLAVEARDGGVRVYDRFRDRITFPIHDPRGGIAGFGGRLLGAESPGQPKYLNTPEGPVFSKGRLLYALHLARDAIRQAGYAVLVEGYLDAIAAHQAGIENVVAGMGTALTRDQARLLLRYCRDVVTAYDADAAGQAATLRGLEVLTQAGLQVRVAEMPEGKDPDECIRSRGADAFRAAVEAAVSLVEYRFRRALARHGSASVEGRVRVVAEMVPVLAALDNAVETEAYLREFSRRLGVDQQAFQSEVAKQRRRERKDWKIPAKRTDNSISPADNKEEKGKTGKKVAVLKAERQLLALMAADPEAYRQVRDRLTPDRFFHKDHQRLAAALFRVLEDGAGPVVLADLPEVRGEADLAPVAAAIDFGATAVDARERARAVADCLRVLEEYARELRRAELERTIRDLEARGETVPRELLQELAALARALKGGTGRSGGT